VHIVHIPSNVLKQRKDANKVIPVLDTVPQTISMPPKESITTLAPKPANNVKAVALISNGQRKTKHLDLLRKRDQLFPRVRLIFLSLQLALTFRSSKQSKEALPWMTLALKQCHVSDMRASVESLLKPSQSTTACSKCTKIQMNGIQ
jgi:hypothetical protein